MNATATATKTACQCRNFKNATTGERLTCDKVTARKFAPGHDARLKGFLIRIGRENHGVLADGHDEELDAREVASWFGFYAQVLAGVAKGPAKARKAKVAKAPKLVQGKVGRWVYFGTVAGDTFSYTDRKGTALATTKFTLI